MLKQIEQLENFIKMKGLFKPQDKILLAVSGGKDSVAMVHLFKKVGFNFGIAHCNFNLRAEESLRDQKFVQKLAEDLNVPFHLQSFDTEIYAKKNQLSIQMAARELRYHYFNDLLATFHYQKVAIAQHQNDAIETVIWNLIRGTGISGLHGIKSLRNDIIRPMLCFTSRDIESLVTDHQIDFVEDSSNASTKYARNQIRLNIIPEMKKLNPSLEATFEKNINYFTALESFLEETVSQHRSQLFKYHGERIEIFITELKKLEAQELLLFELFRPFGFNATTIKDLIKGLDANPGKQFYSDSHCLAVDRTVIILEKKEQGNFINLKINPNQSEVIFGEHVITIKEFTENLKNLKSAPNICYVDANQLIYPLTIRTWQEGDIFKPFGFNGEKKISDYLIQQKVPLIDKKKIPILVNGDGNIIWICGLRSDDRFKVKSNTKRIFILEYTKK